MHSHRVLDFSEKTQKRLGGCYFYFYFYFGHNALFLLPEYPVSF